MSAKDLMDPSPTTLKPTDSISKAVQYIMEHRYRNLPVVDDDGCYMGIFGVNCWLRHVIPKTAIMENGLDNVSFIHDSLTDLHNRLREVEEKPITLCMNTEIETVTPDTPLVETLLILYRTKTSIPVLQEDTCKLLGMISYWDVGKNILSS